LQRAGEPIGQVVAQLVGQRIAVDGLRLRQPLLLVRAECATQKGLAACQASIASRPFERAAAAVRQMIQQQALRSSV